VSRSREDGVVKDGVGGETRAVKWNMCCPFLMT
jgi:hypothetical protein